MSYQPTSLYSEILNGLFMGGTADHDVIQVAAPYRRTAPARFEAIVTLYASARPADWFIQEFRYGVPDAAIKDIDLCRLKEAVEFGYKHWKAGDRVLVRCQAGLNRSGLVTALILMRNGMTASTAIEEIRKHRADIALFNQEYVQWLLAEGENFLISSNTQLKGAS